MEELQISGKRFISSRRAAKDNGYTPDYIGQLIRGGKVRGQKVGRAWYVESDSLANYLANEPQPEDAVVSTPAAEDSTEETIVDSPALVVTAPVAALKVEEAPEPIVVRIHKQQEPIAQDKTEANSAAKKEDVVKDVPAVVKIRKTKHEGLTYVASEEPFLPKIAITPITSMMPHAGEATPTQEPTGARGSTWGGVALTALGLLVFVVSAVLGSSMAATLHLEEGSPASAGYSIEW